MGLVQHRQIREKIEKDYIPTLDLSDAREGDRVNIGLSRGLTALTLSYLTDATAEVATKAIVDGFGDNGIDAVFFDESEKYYI